MTAAATVIIPTYAHAPFLRQAIESARNQTVSDLEICVVCDGSTDEMINMIEALAAKDPRIKSFINSKASGTGEIHRPAVIAATSSPIICYLSHDDLWFPHHVATMKRLLEDADFAHTIHNEIGLGEERFVPKKFIYADISSTETVQAMLNPKVPCNFFGLTFAAHTRDAYNRLEEGWTATPEGIWTDLYMWRKFLRTSWCRCVSYLGVTALHFNKAYWTQLLSGEGMATELEQCLVNMRSPGFLQDFNTAAVRMLFEQRSQRKKILTRVRRRLRRLLGWSC